MKSTSTDTEHIIRVLSRMLQSTQFSGKEKYQQLFEFLVNAQLENRELTEKTIATEIFSKDDSFDPMVDSSVRAYMSNLRKKVERFNLTEGRDEDLQITLPKGGYRVNFIHPGKQKHLFKPFFGRMPLLAVLSTVLCIIVCLSGWAAFYFTNQKNPAFLSPDAPLWNNVLNSDRKTLIVIGDYYFFRMPFDETHDVYARSVFINSESDLSRMLDEKPEFKNRIQNIYHAYLDEHIPLCVARIVPSFIALNRQHELKLSSELRLEDLQKFNIVYIGSYKTLYQLKMVTANLNFKYELRPDSTTIEFFDTNSQTTSGYTFLTNTETRARNDYATVIKVAGHNKNIFYFFISQHDFGNLATVRYLTDPDKLADLPLIMQNGYFEALFEVTGVLRTDFDIKLLHVNDLHSNYKINLE